MNTAVLCGGKGTRLGYDGQKCCVPVNGRPFLLHRLDQLVRCGATQLHLLVSHEAEEVFSVVGKWESPIPINYIYDDGAGPWEAVRDAVYDDDGRLLDIIDTPTFWVANGDTWLEEPLQPSWRPNAVPLMVVTTNDETEPHNIDGKYLDCGLYRVSRKHPVPAIWSYRVIDTRPFTMNTPEQLEELRAHLG